MALEFDSKFWSFAVCTSLARFTVSWIEQQRRSSGSVVRAVPSPGLGMAERAASSAWWIPGRGPQTLRLGLSHSLVADLPTEPSPKLAARSQHWLWQLLSATAAPSLVAVVCSQKLHLTCHEEPVLAKERLKHFMKTIFIETISSMRSFRCCIKIMTTGRFSYCSALKLTKCLIGNHWTVPPKKTT